METNKTDYKKNNKKILGLVLRKYSPKRYMTDISPKKRGPPKFT